MSTYVVVDATAIKGLHAALGRTRVIVLDKTVVEALLRCTSADDRRSSSSYFDKAESDKGKISDGARKINLQMGSWRSCQG